MEKLQDRFGEGNWSVFFQGLQQNDVDLNDLATYQEKDLSEAVELCLPGIQVFQRKKLVLALQEYFQTTRAIIVSENQHHAHTPQRLQNNGGQRCDPRVIGKPTHDDVVSTKKICCFLTLSLILIALVLYEVLSPGLRVLHVTKGKLHPLPEGNNIPALRFVEMNKESSVRGGKMKIRGGDQTAAAQQRSYHLRLPPQKIEYVFSPFLRSLDDDDQVIKGGENVGGMTSQQEEDTASVVVKQSHLRNLLPESLFEKQVKRHHDVDPSFSTTSTRVEASTILNDPAILPLIEGREEREMRDILRPVERASPLTLEEYRHPYGAYICRGSAGVGWRRKNTFANHNNTDNNPTKQEEGSEVNKNKKTEGRREKENMKGAKSQPIHLQNVSQTFKCNGDARQWEKDIPSWRHLLPTEHERCQSIMVRMLFIFSVIMDEKGLGHLWFLTHGSLLGAVRHGGMIPWDVDIDIAVDRSIFDRVERFWYKHFPREMFYQTPSTDPNFRLNTGPSRMNLVITRIHDRYSKYVGFAFGKSSIGASSPSVTSAANRSNSKGTTIMDSKDSHDVDGTAEDAKSTSDFPISQAPSSSARNNDRYKNVFHVGPQIDLLPAWRGFKRSKRQKSPTTTSEGKKLTAARGESNSTSAVGQNTSLARPSSSAEEKDMPKPLWVLSSAFPEESVYPTKRMCFEGVMLPVPKDYTHFLDIIYGKDNWKKLPSLWEQNLYFQHGAKCKSIAAEDPIDLDFWWLNYTKDMELLSPRKKERKKKGEEGRNINTDYNNRPKEPTDQFPPYQHRISTQEKRTQILQSEAIQENRTLPCPTSPYFLPRHNPPENVPSFAPVYIRYAFNVSKELSHRAPSLFFRDDPISCRYRKTGKGKVFKCAHRDWFSGKGFKRRP